MYVSWMNLDENNFYFVGDYLMRQRSILRIINKMPYELSDDERKTQIFFLIPFGLIFNFVLTYIWFGLLMGFNFLPFFFIFCFIIIGVILILYYWDKLDEKYRMRPINSPFQLSYQGYALLLLCWAPAFFFGMLSLGLSTNNLWFGLGGAVAIVYPILGMFLRIRTFSDDSIVFSRKAVLPKMDINRELSSGVLIKNILPNVKGNLPSGDREITETVKGFGYMPLSYWLLSAMLGLYITGSGFSDIHLYFTKGSPSLEATILIIILGLIVQSVYLFPDKLNKIVPIELRTKNGFFFMFILAFVLFGISQWLIGILSV